MRREMLSLAVSIAMLLIILFCSVVYALSVVAVDISWHDIAVFFYYKILGYGAQGLDTADAVNYDIIFSLRMPRVLMAIICGGGLALGGTVTQAIVRNPLAEPYILGISSGAALGATVSIILGVFHVLGIYGTAFGAFAGSLLITFSVFAITYKVNSRGNTTRLVLTGTALNAICGAAMSLIIYMSKDVEGLRDVTFWLMGSMARVSWEVIPINIGIFLLCCGYFLYQFRNLNASLLGDELAVIMGIRLSDKRGLYLFLIALLVSTIVASVGVVGFVGLVIPHVVRLIYGNDHVKLLPIAILLGSVYMVWCDILARVLVTNTEIPIGILTAFIGGPFFLYLLMNKKYGYGDI